MQTLAGSEGDGSLAKQSDAFLNKQWPLGSSVLLIVQYTLVTEAQTRVCSEIEVNTSWTNLIYIPNLYLAQCCLVLVAPGQCFRAGVKSEGIFNSLNFRKQINVYECLWPTSMARHLWDEIIRASIPFSFAIAFAVLSFPFLNAQSTSHRSSRVSAHLENSRSFALGNDSTVAKCVRRSRSTSCVGLPEDSCSSESYHHVSANLTPVLDRLTLRFRFSTLVIMLSIDLTVSSCEILPLVAALLSSCADDWTAVISRSTFFWDVRKTLR